MSNKRTLPTQQFLNTHVYLTGAKSLERITAFPKYQTYSYLSRPPTQNQPSYSKLAQSIPYRLHFHSPHHSKIPPNHQKHSREPFKQTTSIIKPPTPLLDSRETLQSNAYLVPQQVSEREMEQNYEKVMQKSSKVLQNLKKRLEAVRGINKELILQNCKLRSKLNKLDPQR